MGELKLPDAILTGILIHVTQDALSKARTIVEWPTW
jgi:hypothetical protein